jgi:hypothetical protein
VQVLSKQCKQKTTNKITVTRKNKGNMKQKIENLKFVNDSAGRRVFGTINGKGFKLFRQLSNSIGGGRYTRGLADVPSNWHVKASTGGTPLTRSEAIAAKRAGMALIEESTKTPAPASPVCKSEQTPSCKVCGGMAPDSNGVCALCKSEDKATARPWEVVSNSITNNVVILEKMRVGFGKKISDVVKKDDAALIVNAVNFYDNYNAEHAALVAVAEAAKLLKSDWCWQGDVTYKVHHTQPLIDALNALEVVLGIDSALEALASVRGQ